MTQEERRIIVDLRTRMEHNLKTCILPFWTRYMTDQVHGGFYGRVDGSLQPDLSSPKSMVLNGRMLWTYSRAWDLSLIHIYRNGNVNVSSFNRRCTGPGGFINISQSTPKVYFMCAFTAGKTEIQVGDGKLSIRKDGAGVKFVEKVQQDVYKRQGFCHTAPVPVR